MIFKYQHEEEPPSVSTRTTGSIAIREQDRIIKTLGSGDPIISIEKSDVIDMFSGTCHVDIGICNKLMEYIVDASDLLLDTLNIDTFDGTLRCPKNKIAYGKHAYAKGIVVDDLIVTRSEIVELAKVVKTTEFRGGYILIQNIAMLYRHLPRDAIIVTSRPNIWRGFTTHNASIPLSPAHWAHPIVFDGRVDIYTDSVKDGDIIHKFPKKRGTSKERTIWVVLECVGTPPAKAVESCILGRRKQKFMGGVGQWPYVVQFPSYRVDAITCNNTNVMNPIIGTMLAGLPRGDNRYSTECMVCLEHRSDFVEFQCGHYLCLDCCVSCVRTIGSEFPCPMCRGSVNIEQGCVKVCSDKIAWSQFVNDDDIVVSEKPINKKYTQLTTVVRSPSDDTQQIELVGNVVVDKDITGMGTICGTPRAVSRIIVTTGVMNKFPAIMDKFATFGELWVV